MSLCRSKANSLLSLAELGDLLLSSSLGCLRTALSVQDVVPPSERAGVVADELLVVDVVMISTSPEGKEVVQAPGELVARVGVDGLEETKDDPNVHGKDVEVLGNGAPEDGDTDGAETQTHDLDRGSVFSGETEGSRVLVVDLVDGLV